jgi:hypothetical protein
MARYNDYISQFPNGRPYFGTAQDDSDNVSLPDSERQRLYQESLGTLAEAIKNPTANGWISRGGNIPTFDQWAAGNPEIVGDNDPRYQYLQQFYEGTNKSDIFETLLPALAMSGMAGAAGGLFGNLGTGEFAGMGTFGSAAPAAAPASSAVGSSAAPAAGGAASGAPVGVTGSSVSPLIDSLVPAIDVGAPAFGSSLGTVGTGAAAGGFSIPGMVTNLANSTELIPSLGGAAGGAGILGSIVNGAKNLFAPGNGNGSGLNLGNVLGGALQGGLGYLGADKMADAYQNIYNQSRADRMPALGAFNTALSDPNSFYNSAPAMGATDAVLRKLSMQGNPANNPGLLSQAAAYNLGGYNDYLRALSGPAFGTAGIEAQTGMGQAQAQGGGLNAIGYGLNTAFQQPSAFDEYYRAAAKRLNTGTPTNGILGLV